MNSQQESMQKTIKEEQGMSFKTRMLVSCVRRWKGYVLKSAVTTLLLRMAHDYLGRVAHGEIQHECETPRSCQGDYGGCPDTDPEDGREEIERSITQFAFKVS